MAGLEGGGGRWEVRGLKRKGFAKGGRGREGNGSPGIFRYVLSQPRPEDMLVIACAAALRWHGDLGIYTAAFDRVSIR